MEFFNSLNSYILSHPAMLTQLEFAFRIKWWCLLLLFLVFFYLPIHEEKKRKAKKTSVREGQFLA